MKPTLLPVKQRQPLYALLPRETMAVIRREGQATGAVWLGITKLLTPSVYEKLTKK